MKKILLLAGAFVALIAQQATAAVTISLANGDDDGDSAKVVTYQQWKAAGGVKTSSLVPESVPLLSTMPNKIYQLSGPSSASSHTTTYRQRVMKWLGGGSVSMDRTLDPTAVYLIPRHSGMSQPWGLQLYDMATTGFPFWNGQAPPDTNSTAIANATWHRIVVPLIASGNQMRKYWVRVTTSSTIIGNSMFPVATNSANGQEIAFNSQYIAIDLGENGNLDSFQDPGTGQLVQAGDDTIHTSGFPSSLEGHYDTVLRFGSTIAVTVSDYASFASLKNEFASNNITLKVELVLKESDSETVLDSYETSAAVCKLAIAGLPNNVVRLTNVGGQTMLVNQLESRPDIQGSSWSVARPDMLPSGRFWDEPTDGMHFFRLRQAPGQ